MPQTARLLGSALVILQYIILIMINLFDAETHRNMPLFVRTIACEYTWA
jgi:hypothetical protein